MHLAVHQTHPVAILLATLAHQPAAQAVATAAVAQIAQPVIAAAAIATSVITAKLGSRNVTKVQMNI